MERGNKEKILDMIKGVEKKTSEMEDYISNLSILSRNDMLKEITQDIIKNNSLLQELLGSEDKTISIEKKGRISSLDYIIDGFISKIQKDPHKKVIFLREFLELFQERISEEDKEVIIKSLKDEKNDEKLREEMVSLANTFKLNL